MFNLFAWVTMSVREAFLAGIRQAIEIVQTGDPGDSQEAQRLLALTSGHEAEEPINRLLEESNGNGRRGRGKA